MKKTKQEFMQEMLRELKDIENSQEALIEKSAQLQIDLINTPDKGLETALIEIHTKASQCFDLIQETRENYQTGISQGDD